MISTGGSISEADDLRSDHGFAGRLGAWPLTTYLKDSSMSLVAKVNVRAHKDGAVIKFAPGDEIPNGAIPQHDLAYLIQVGSVDEARAWAARFPNPFPGQACQIEVRQLYEEADFAPGGDMALSDAAPHP